MRHQCTFSAPSWAPTLRNTLCYSESDWSKLYDLHPIFYGPLSTLLHPVLASSYPLWQDFSKRASFPIVCVDWFYEKAVWGVVKSWEFEGNLRCSKILRRKTPMKWVLSISRDYWVYFDITVQSFKMWEFWGELRGIETFYWNKFSPATGVTTVLKSRTATLLTPTLPIVSSILSFLFFFSSALFSCFPPILNGFIFSVFYYILILIFIPLLCLYAQAQHFFDCARERRKTRSRWRPWPWHRISLTIYMYVIQGRYDWARIDTKKLLASIH